MNELQSRMLEVLLAVQEVCRSHDIRYFASGGTAIGALRHGGFIPWDDDVDVEMPMTDYLRFLDAWRADGPAHLELRDPMEDEFPLSPVAVVHDPTTTTIDLFRHPKSYRGVGVDICPLMGLPDDEERAVEVMAEVHELGMTMLRGSIYPVDGDRSAATAAAAFRKLRMSVDFDSTRFACYAIPHSIPGRRPFLTQSYRTARLVSFETSEIPVPEGADDLFHRMGYGDWRVPPGEGDRAGHASWFVDVRRPYREYAAEAPTHFLFAGVTHLSSELRRVEDAYADAVAALRRESDEHARVTAAYDTLMTEVDRVNSAYGAAAEEIDRLGREVERLGSEIDRLTP